ncbi:MAG: GtrA family protein [Myxococcota bacterium]
MIREFLRARLGPEQRRFVKFCVVGASGVVVNMAFLWLGLQMFDGLDKAPREAAASALGIVVSVFGNFLLNDLWTWGDRLKGDRRRDLAFRIGRYYVASALAIGIQFGCAQLLALGFGVLIYAAQGVGIAFGTVFNYVANNVWTFRDQE